MNQIPWPVRVLMVLMLGSIIPIGLFFYFQTLDEAESQRAQTIESRYMLATIFDFNEQLGGTFVHNVFVNDKDGHACIFVVDKTIYGILDLESKNLVKHTFYEIFELGYDRAHGEPDFTDDKFHITIMDIRGHSIEDYDGDPVTPTTI